MSTEAMKLAIAKEALEKLAKLGNGDRYGNSIGNSIAMEALDKMAENARELGLSYEQPAQQEPDPDELTIAYLNGIDTGKKRKPLTDEQIAEIAAQGHHRWIEFARAIEAAHGITKGTP